MKCAARRDPLAESMAFPWARAAPPAESTAVDVRGIRISPAPKIWARGESHPRAWMITQRPPLDPDPNSRGVPSIATQVFLKTIGNGKEFSLLHMF
jgi:hypothetical protein